jgi:hypothetical protein
MPIDSSIPFQALNTPVPLMSMQQHQQNALARQMSQLQMQEQQGQMQDRQQQRNQQNALAMALQGSRGADGQIDYDKLSASSGINPMDAMKFSEQGRQIKTEQATAQRAAEKAKLEKAKSDIDLIAQVAGGARDQQSYALGVARLRQMGVDVGDLPPNYDPAFVQGALRQALSAKEQLDQYWRQQGFDQDERKFSYQQQNDAASRAVQVRGQNLTDARVRESNELKREENSIARDGIVGKKIQDVELKLQDDYRTESKGFAETSTAMKKILGSIKTADKNPGSALAAGTAFMKLLDPTSVVRESELGMALNASGWFDRAFNLANTLRSGKVMTPEQKVNLESAAITLFNEAKAAQREVDNAYRRRAVEYGGNPDRVIVDRGQGRDDAKTIPDGAVKFLRSNPAMAAQFDQKYGAGAAAKYLKGQ